MEDGEEKEGGCTTFRHRLKYSNYKKAQWLSPTNPRDAKACQKLLQFDVLTTLSLTILHSLSCCCVRNLRNPENSLKLQTYRVQGHRSWCQSKAHMQLSILVINSNFGRRPISHSFRDIDTFSYKIACFPHHTIV